MTTAEIIRILEIVLLSAGGIILAINGRKKPKVDDAEAKTKLEQAENEHTSSQFNANKTLVDSTKELISISQQLISSVEEHNKILRIDYDQLRARFETMETETSKTLKKLDRDYNRVLYISSRFVHGIKLLITQLEAIGIKPIWTPPQELLDTIDRRVKASEE